MGRCSEHRSQHENKKVAFVRMANSETFETWRRMEAMRRLGQFPKSIEERVDEMMADENLMIEYLGKS